jgi:surface protein
MKGLFCNCSALSIMPDISKWDTSNVTNMSCMFYNCSSLLSLPDLKEWKISKVEDMKAMFTNCNKLPEKVIPNIFKI